MNECQRCWARIVAVRNTWLKLLCNSWSPNFRSDMSVFIFNKWRVQSGNKSKERLRCALLYSLPVESMLAWQHSQLVFHFEVLETHGTRLLCKWQTGRSETEREQSFDEIIVHSFLSFLCRIIKVCSLHRNQWKCTWTSHSYPMKTQLLWISF